MLNNGGIQSLATVEFPQTYDPFIPMIAGEQSFTVSVKLPGNKHKFSLNLYDNFYGCLTSLSIIFQLYHDGQFYWLEETEIHGENRKHSESN